MTKPRLFIDVDGVILARYGKDGFFQMRPYVGDFLRFAVKNFHPFWLTCHGPLSTDSIASLNSMGGNQIGYAEWRHDAMDKVGGVIANGGLSGEWFTVEDEYPLREATAFLKGHGLLHRWIIVPRTGRDVLLQTMKELERRILTAGRSPR